MKLLTAIFLCIFLFAVPVSAMEFTAPPVPESGLALMPEGAVSFADGLGELAKKGAGAIRPDLREAAGLAVSMVCIVLMVSLLNTFSGPAKRMSELTGTVMTAVLFLKSTQTMIPLAVDTITQISDYGKLLLMVLAAALAAQGGITSSAALYAGTALFDSILTQILNRFLVSGVWLFLALSIANSATGEDMLRKAGDLVKNVLNWMLKTLLMVYTTYLSITGVVSGTTDAAALKAAKVTISSFVPVVGGVLSDSAEAVLVSAGVMKNAAGVYGILAILAVVLHPFLKLGIHYLILKVTAAMCAIFGSKPICDLIDRFAAAMGLLLGMTGACCVLFLISTVCFMKGIA